MKYPYIANNNLMFYAKNTATFVGDEDNLNTHGFKITANESKFTNITREYLEGKCVKIESPEHSVFVQKLAFNNDVLFHIDANYDVIYFYGLNDALDLNDISMWTVITIPLPPKAESETKEWPQIGDKVCYGNGVNCEVTGIHNEVAMILTERGDYHIAYLSELKKPKTEAEILRGCVWDTVSEYIEKESIIDAVTTDLINNYNITKKPQ